DGNPDASGSEGGGGASGRRAAGVCEPDRLIDQEKGFRGGDLRHQQRRRGPERGDGDAAFERGVAPVASGAEDAGDAVGSRDRRPDEEADGDAEGGGAAED